MKTKELLAITLQELMKKNNLDKITIKNLTQACGINRQTFYYHFKDIYELVYWMLDVEGEKLLRDKNLLVSPNNIVLYLYDYLIANEESIRAIYFSLSKSILERYIVDKTQILLLSLLDNDSRLNHVKKDVKKEVCNFYKYSFVGYAFEWIRNGMSRNHNFPLEIVGQVVTDSVINTVLSLHELSNNDN